jgi:hypothetical protein
MPAARRVKQLEIHSSVDASRKRCPWDRLRVCSSKDLPGTQEKGLCRPPEFDYFEIRLDSRNWLSAIISTWLAQIMLSAILGVPVSIEAGGYNVRRSFYDPDSRMDLDLLEMTPDRSVGASADRPNCNGNLASRTKTHYETCSHFTMERGTRNIQTMRKNVSLRDCWSTPLDLVSWDRSPG